jgi:excinuclease ABC subunit A
MSTDTIRIRGARQHNLKNINLTLPRNRLVVITGLSGSGKSSLAFDTLYAEGQRRYVESLSTYARQFLERLAKPDVDVIEGLSPAIAIEQKTAGHNPRSTVGTVTEIYDYLRLLFARVGTVHCHQCGRIIAAMSLDQMVGQVLALPANSRILVLAPLISGQKGTHEKLFKRLKRDGFARVRVDGRVMEIDAVGKLQAGHPHTIDVVVDRLIIKEKIHNRLADSLELALSLSEGTAAVSQWEGQTFIFSEKAVCPECHIACPDLTPAHFSFNSPLGACPKCGGIGATREFDPDLIVPNPLLSIREGAVIPWAGKSSVHFAEFLDALASHYNVNVYTPWCELPAAFRQTVLNGSGEQAVVFHFERASQRITDPRPFEGIIPSLERRYVGTHSTAIRDEIQQFMTFRPCTTCQGTRLNPVSRAVKVANHSIAQVTALSIGAALAFFENLSLAGKQAVIAKGILKEIKDRLGFLENVGLGYLTLDRSASSLSGGESQRIRLATQIGSKLTGVLYVLDEPSIGLHQRDNQRLLSALLQMRDLGNTVLVVEHDPETILAADHVVDMGPGAGDRGGQVIFTGAPADLLNAEDSLTGQYLSGRKTISVPVKRRIPRSDQLVVQGASMHNLKNIDVGFPLGCLICVTGVSGSGKSTLVLETLYPALMQRLHAAKTTRGACRQLTGIEHVDKVIHVDQAPIGRTPRSNPATYTGLFAAIRDLFARTPDARMRGYRSGRFSFNVKGGRCEACQGDGIVKIEMHFLPDIYVPCDVCLGKRYNRETLEIRYKGKNIAEVLDMTVEQSLAFFENIGTIRDRLKTLADVGLGYMRIGQPATTLSGGEAQRIKLTRELSKRTSGRSVYILDEPTTGLHVEDVSHLLNVLGRLVDAGNTVIVIEHHLDVIKTADYIIDLGPEGGDDGGRVVGTGPPERIAGMAGSHTGHFLAPLLVS